MLDLEKMINLETGNQLVFSSPNLYVEIDKEGEIIHTWNNVEKAPPIIKTCKTLKNNQYQNDTAFYHLPDDYGGFPSHW